MDAMKNKTTIPIIVKKQLPFLHPQVKPVHPAMASCLLLFPGRDKFFRARSKGFSPTGFINYEVLFTYIKTNSTSIIKPKRFITLQNLPL
jgi:hypothetical protein